jgi:hypothetical protein
MYCASTVRVIAAATYKRWPWISELVKPQKEVESKLCILQLQ